MKKLLALLLLPLAAHAQVPHIETGSGYQSSGDMGDGVWYQQGGPHTHKLSSPAFLAGLTGTVYESGPWSVNYHLDYVYYGTMSASCECVPDNEYNVIAHQRIPQQGAYTLGRFNGSGHVQGIPLTLDLGYTYNGVRFAVEGGMWAYWSTWHESAVFDYGAVNASHRTHAQFGYVAGARIEKGPFSVSYRYYQVRDLWNPNPGIVTGTHMIMAVYRF